jgi:hypothetical protein
MQKKTKFYIHYNMDFEKAIPPCALYGLRFFSSFVIPFVVILNGFIV